MNAPLKRAVQSLFAALTVAACSHALAQSYPIKPIRIVVPFAAGGAVDTVARAVVQKLTDAWKQPIIVENRLGAGGIIASEAVARAPADGYTFLVVSISQAVTPSIYRTLPYDPLKDLEPVTQLTSSFLVLTATPKLPVTSLRDLVALAKSKPGGLNYGSTGVGTSTHLLAELLKIQAGINLVHVPYKGDAPQVAALLSGEVHIGLGPLLSVLPHIKAGRLRPLAILGDKRASVAPDVPTMAEAGLAGFDLTTTWIGVFAPAGVPGEILTKFQNEIVKVLAIPDIRTLFSKWGYDPVGNTSQEFSARYRADVATYARVIKEAGIPLQ